MNRRILDLKTGYGCNNNCVFCVTHDNKVFGDRTTSELKGDLKESVDRCDTVIFTGGEVTIRSDLLELISYAKHLGFKSIELQSNCRMLANKDFLRKVIDAGVTGFGPSLHGHTAELHDSLTRVPGSFHQTVKAIMNMKELGHEVGTNTVITKQNYKSLPKIASLLINLKVDQFQMSFVHPMGGAMKSFRSVVPKMNEVKPFLHKAIQVGLNAGTRIQTEGIPFCIMHGYEDLISESVLVDTETKSGVYADMNWLSTRKSKAKKKPKSCVKCKFDPFCEGTWKEYIEKIGSDEFNAKVRRALTDDAKIYIKSITSRGIHVPTFDKRNGKIYLKWVLGRTLKNQIYLGRYNKSDAFKSLAKISSSIHDSPLISLSQDSVVDYTQKRVKSMLKSLGPKLKSAGIYSICASILENDFPEEFTPDLIHGDIHPRNIIINEGDFFLIDYETVRKASLEEDVLFLVLRDKTGAFAREYRKHNLRTQRVLDNIMKNIDFYSVYSYLIDNDLSGLKEFLSSRDLVHDNNLQSRQ